MIAHNGSAFDSYVELNNLPQRRNVVSLIKNGAGNFLLKIVNGIVDEKKNIPQYVHFRRGRVHIFSSLQRIGVGDKSQLLLLKQEMDHDGTFEDTWEARENGWLPYVKNEVLSTAFFYARYTMVVEKVTNSGMKSNSTLLR